MKHYIIEYPEQMAQWNYEKNNKLNLFPEQISASSSKKVWWKCPVCQYEWEKSPNNKTYGKGCPVCANKIIIPGYNDLKTKFPNIAKEWNYNRNQDKKPENYAPFSTQKVWWLCEFGHEWETKICNRTNRNRGCPICNATFKTSFPEQAIYFYLLKLFPDAINRYSYKGKEIDVYIPSLKVGIEYNGNYFHKDRINNDLSKEKFLQENKISLFVIKDGQSNQILNNQIIYKNDLTWAIQGLLKKLNKTFDINIDRDKNEIKSFYFQKRKSNSLQSLYPKIADEWDYEKNYPITPDMVHCGSHDQYWWKCKKGHSWKTSVKQRTKRGRGCFICHSESLGKRIICKETRKIYKSFQEAQRKTGICYPTISNVCNGKRHLAGGYHWSFYYGPYMLQSKDFPFSDELEYKKEE